MTAVVVRSPSRPPPAVLCWQLFHVSTPSTPRTSLCPAPPCQLRLCKDMPVQDKLGEPLGFRKQVLLRGTGGWGLHHDCGAPSHCFGGRDQALGPAGVLGIKFLHGGCPLVDKRGFIFKSQFLLLSKMFFFLFLLLDV